MDTIFRTEPRAISEPNRFRITEPNRIRESTEPNRMREKDPNPEDGGTPNRTGGTYPNRTEHGELDEYFYYFVMTLLKTNSNSIKTREAKEVQMGGYYS